MLISMVQAWIAIARATAAHRRSSAEGSSTWKENIEWEGTIKTVVEPGKIWRVWYHATTWPARSDSLVEFRPGDRVKVTGRQGLTLSIEPWETNDK